MTQTNSELRTFSISVASDADVRLETMMGKEHVVVPVVMMVGDSAIEPMNSTGPEFVPSEVLAVAPAAWDGSPVLPIHPTSPDGNPVSANSPTVLEQHAFGQVFNTYFDGTDNKLKAEAWMDPSRAEQVEGAEEVIQIVTSDDPQAMAELSVGAYVGFVEASGQANGKTYNKAWADVKPDHLAIFSDGSVGACSNDLGCGAPRINQAKKDNPMKSLASFFSQFFSANVEGQSDTDLRRALDAAIRAVEPGYEFIENVYPSDNTVIYSAWPEDRWILYSRSYSMNESGDVELADDRQEVEPVTRFEPVAAIEDTDESVSEADSADLDTASEAECQCRNGEGHAAPAEPDPDTVSEGETMNETIEQLVGRLIANERSPFTEDSAEALSAFSEDTLTAMAEGYEADESAPADESVADEGAVDETPAEELSEEEQIDALPEALKSLVRAAQKRDEAHRTNLIESITAAQSFATAEDLEAKSTETLEQIAGMLDVNTPPVDHSGQGLSFNRDADNDDQAPAVPSMSERFSQAN